MRYLGPLKSNPTDYLTRGELPFIGENGRKYRFVSGVLRNSGSGWGWINDAGHQPSGLGAVTQDATKITINHAVSGLKVSSLQVTPDETYASRGLRCGASVGVDLTNISLYTASPYSIGDRVYYNGTAWVSDNNVFSMSYASSILTLTHESMGTGPDAYSIVSARGTAFAAAATVTDTTTLVAFYTGTFTGTTSAASTSTSGAASTGTAHTHSIAHTHTLPGLTGFGSPTTALSVHVVRYGIRSVPPADPSTVALSSGNLWVTGFIEV